MAIGPVKPAEGVVETLLGGWMRGASHGAGKALPLLLGGGFWRRREGRGYLQMLDEVTWVVPLQGTGDGSVSVALLDHRLPSGIPTE